MEISDDPEDPRADSVNNVYEGRSNAKNSNLQFKSAQNRPRTPLRLRNSHERYVAFHRLPNYMNLARDHGTFRARVGLPP